jgi:outer membrane protein OmpA-like peptidoglycan-associated protein
MLSVSTDLELALLNGVGGIGILGKATSVGLRLAASADLRKLEGPVPLILRTALRYYFDNSGRIVEDIEQSRYDSLSDPRPRPDETRNLVSNVERFVFRVNRLDTLTWTLGVEVPLSLDPWTVAPIAEWAMGVPVNRQGYDCLVRTSVADPDGCLESEGAAAWPTTFTAGLRVLPPLRGLSALLAVDVATSGDDVTVRELAPNAPYDLLLSFSYAYDVREPEPVIVERRVTVQLAPEPLGHIVGEVVDIETNLPVSQAIVHLDSLSLTDLATDEQGRFVTYELPGGAYTLRVTAAGYEPGTCGATLPAGGVDQALRCDLTPLPKHGALKGNVKDDKGAPIATAIVKLTGPSSATLASDDAGTFAQGELPPGRYTFTVEAPGYLLKAGTFTLAHDEVATPSIVLVPQPKVASAELRTEDIVIKKQVQFVVNSAELRPESDGLLSEVADVLLRNPQVLKVEVQGHTDERGSAAFNLELSQRRAEAVRDWLVAAGVDPNRLTAVGYGSSRPRAPNITEQNRARNRRVQFMILEQ